MTDGELVRQTLRGRTAAYDHLVRRWSSRVLAVCHARVHIADVAEELTQESLFRGFRALATLGDAEKFGSWLCGIATRVCLDWLKDKDRTQVSLGSMGEGTAAENLPDGRVEDCAGEIEAQEEIRDLMDEVQRLPDTHREVLMLYYYDDWTYHELGELLGVSAATINARLTQARQMLRDRLTRKESTRR